MDWSWITGAVGGLAVGLLGGFATVFLAPVQRWIARIGRRAVRERGVTVTTETDVEAIYAGLPDWGTFRTFMPGPVPVQGPVGSRSGWQSWSSSAGCYDYGFTAIAITIVAESETTVVMRPPAVTIHDHAPAPEGGVLARYAGGASISPLGFDVQLDAHPEVAILTDADGDRLTPPLRWALQQGDVQTVLLRVHCGTPGLWRWSARIPLLIDGRPVIETVSGPGGPFVLAGEDDSLTELSWNGRSWREEDAESS